jgi:SAM-dependent methyltransferase
MNRYLKVAINRVRNKYRVFAYKGTNVECEMCDWKGKQFFKGRCPKCNSLPRTRLIPFSIRHFHLENKMDNILHIAPNFAEYNFVLNKIRYKVYDRLNITPHPIINLQQDITKTQIRDEVYDISIIWHVLEHIPDDISAISELYRITKKGGRVLVSVPIHPDFNKETYEDKNIPREKYKEIHGHEDHCRSCGLDYYKRFENAGFKTHTLNVIDLAEKDINKFGLSKNHVVWMFEK